MDDEMFDGSLGVARNFLDEIKQELIGIKLIHA